jgi:hypothetical protein
MRDAPDATAAIRGTGRIKKKRHPLVRAFIALILVGVLALGAEAGYLYWKWRSILERIEPHQGRDSKSR